MSIERILSAKLGLDVVSEETFLPAGAVRRADNVVLGKAGSFSRRDGYALDKALTNAHSLWHGKINPVTLVVADGTLYKVVQQGANMTATSLATGLIGTRAYYAEYAASVYISCGIMARLDNDGLVRAPGIASLLGYKPVLTAAASGGLLPGKYQVAFSAVNDLGEESGLSDVESIELTVQGKINLVLPTPPTGAVYWRLYRTTTNGDELYLAAKVAATTSASISFGDVSRKETTWMRAPLPAGGQLAVHHGRLYSPLGTALCYSDAFNPNLTSARDGFIPFPDSCEGMVLSLNSGLYVGTPSAVYFLEGGSPNSFTMRLVSDNGVIPGSGSVVDATLFDQRLVDGGSGEVAVWLSPNGYQIGLQGGKVLSPQVDRITLSDCTSANTLAFTRGGVNQLISATDTFSLGVDGATDSVS